MFTIRKYTKAQSHEWKYSVRKNGEWYANANSLSTALEYVAYAGTVAFPVEV